MWKFVIFRSRYLINGDFPCAKRFISSSAALSSDYTKKRINDSVLEPVSNSSVKLPQSQLPKSQPDAASPELMSTIKSFLRTEELLQFLKTNPNLQTYHYETIFSTINTFQKLGHSNISNDEVCRNPDFERLCQAVKKDVRLLNVKETITIFKTLLWLNVSSNSLLSQSLLQMISKNVNKLTVQQLIFLNFLMKQCHSSPLVEALKLSTPVVFEAIVRPALDQGNPGSVFRAFLFAFYENVSEDTRDFLVDVALRVHDKFTASQAQRILVAICKAKQTSPPRRALYNSLMDQVAESMGDQLSSTDVNQLVGACLNAYINTSEMYFHRTFLDNAIDYAIDHRASILEVGNLLRNYTRVSYPCYKLMDYLDEKLAKEDDFELIGSLEPFISFLNCCSNCSYKPKFWNSYQEKFVALIDRHKTDQIPILRIVTDLVVMKCWVSSLIEYCFRDEFLDSFLSRETNFIDYLAVLRLYQAVQTVYPGGYKHSLPPASIIEEAVKMVQDRSDFPLEGALAYAFGGNKYILSGVCTRYGHFLDHLLVRQKNGKMAIINENEVKGRSGIAVESLELPAESLMIGVLLLSPASYCLDGMKIRGMVRLKIHSLEALGIAVIPISKLVFMSLPDHEKIPYLENKIVTRPFIHNAESSDDTLIELDQ